MSATPATLEGEDGFTLVEMLAAMVVSMIVLFAILQSLDVFTQNTARQTRLTDANDQVRLAMDRTVSDLRGASVIITATATDLAYSVAEAANVRTERLCLSSGYLYRSTSTSATVPAAPAAACSTGTKLGPLKATNASAFTYDGVAAPANPALVKNVGLTLSLDASGGGTTRSSTLKASAARRSAGTLPITDDDLNSKCGPTGPILSLSAGIPNVAGLTVTYADAGGVALGVGAGTASTTIPLVSGTVNVVATVTDALGVTNIIHRSIECNHP